MYLRYTSLERFRRILGLRMYRKLLKEVDAMLAAEDHGRAQFDRYAATTRD